LKQWTGTFIFMSMNYGTYYLIIKLFLSLFSSSYLC